MDQTILLLLKQITVRVEALHPATGKHDRKQILDLIRNINEIIEDRNNKICICADGRTKGKYYADHIANCPQNHDPCCLIDGECTHNHP